MYRDTSTASSRVINIQDSGITVFAIPRKWAEIEHCAHKS